MTTEPTLLQERIARALTHHWQRKHSTRLQSGPCSGCSRVAAVAAEVHAAQAGQELADKLKAAEAQVRAVRELHTAAPVAQAWGYSRSLPADALLCEHCTDPDDHRPAPWPCPTIEALNGEE